MGQATPTRPDENGKQIQNNLPPKTQSKSAAVKKMPGAQKRILAAWNGYFDRWGEWAAITIQKHWRGFSVRQKGLLFVSNPQRVLAAIVCLQRHFRGYRAREKVKVLRRVSKTREEQRQRRRKKREEAASICIQRHLRGHVARSHVRRIVDQNRRNSAARVIQACYQEYRARSLAAMLASQKNIEEGVQKTHKQANVQASMAEGNSEETIEADRCSLLSNDLVAECCSGGRGDGGCVDSVDTCSNEGEAAVGSDPGSDSSAPQLKPLILRSPGDGRLAPNIKDSFWFEKHPISAAGVRAHVRAVEMNLQEKDLREDLFERARKCCSQYQSSAEALKQLKLRRQTRSPPGAIPRVHVTSWRRLLP